MKILALTNLFPSAWDPLRASFNRQQFDRLAEHHDLEVLVAIDFHSRWRGPAGQPPQLRHARSSDFTFWYPPRVGRSLRSEEHTSELQSLMRISYAVFCLQKNNKSHKQ